MRGNPILLAFNRGIMSLKALARVDLKKTILAAEVMRNWLPRNLGSMSLRPGTRYMGQTADNAEARLLPFVFSTNDTALVELTDSLVRVWDGDTLLHAPAVSTALTNGEFTTDLTGWTDVSEVGATATWLTGGAALTGNGTKKAAILKGLSVSAGDQTIRHSVRISTDRTLASCELRIGTTPGGKQLAGPITLRPGEHMISFMPTVGAVYLFFSNQSADTARIESVALLNDAPVALPSLWTVDDLPNVRWEQSGSVVFLCDGRNPQQRLERWGEASWSLVEYRAGDGPFLPTNVSDVTITSSAGTAPYSARLTASAELFTAAHVGGLFRLERTGQFASKAITGDDQWTGSIRVTNVDKARIFTVTVANKTGGDPGKVTLQRSLGGEGDWFVVATYTANTTVAFDDGLDNNIAYYRLGVVTGEYGADDFTVSLSYAAGVSTDVIRVARYVSPVVVDGVIVSSLGGFGETDTWWEGRWSGYRGWPSAVALFEGRLWWAGADKIDGSVSDAYESFDDTVEGDSGPISRNIAIGPVDVATWMAGLDRLLLGTEGAEFQARSSSLDEPLAPSAFSLRAVSTQGSARVPPVKLDTSAVFVHRTGDRLYEIAPSDNGYGYNTNDLMTFAPDIGKPGLLRVAIQRQPDTRVYGVRSDGVLVVLVHDRAEGVDCWVEFTTEGAYEDVAVLPATGGDVVYVVVNRTIDGSTVRYVERFLPEAEEGQAAASCLVDSHLLLTGPAASFSGLDHLEGEEVTLWGDGVDLGTATVSGGSVTLASTVTTLAVGLPYTASFKSARIIVSDTAPFMAAKQITHLGLILLDTHAQGLRYGQSFDYLDDLPLREGYADIDTDGIHTVYEEQTVEVNGTWTPDARLCLEAASPRPCTVVACLVDITGHGK